MSPTAILTRWLAEDGSGLDEIKVLAVCFTESDLARELRRLRRDYPTAVTRSLAENTAEMEAAGAAMEAVGKKEYAAQLIDASMRVANAVGDALAEINEEDEFFATQGESAARDILRRHKGAPVLVMWNALIDFYAPVNQEVFEARLMKAIEKAVVEMGQPKRAKGEDFIAYLEARRKALEAIPLGSQKGPAH